MDLSVSSAMLAIMSVIAISFSSFDISSSNVSESASSFPFDFHLFLNCWIQSVLCNDNWIGLFLNLGIVPGWAWYSKAQRERSWIVKIIIFYLHAFFLFLNHFLISLISWHDTSLFSHIRLCLGWCVLTINVDFLKTRGLIWIWVNSLLLGTIFIFLSPP